MKYTFHTCDVFTNVRFGGNPLAVVLGADDLSAEQMQIVAKEFNLSETVFVLAPKDRANTARVRIFTPKNELPFAGHPTVGTACLLARLSQSEGDFNIDIKLEENAGLVPVKVKSFDGKISAQFVAPGLPEVVTRDIDRRLVASALSIDGDEIGFDSHQPQAVSSGGNNFLFVPVKDRKVLSRVVASFPQFNEAEKAYKTMSCVIYTTDGVNEATDYSVRMLAPGEGIAEDPATGSAAATFPGQLVAFETFDDGLIKWTVEQGVDMGRPSQLYVEADVAASALTEIRVGGEVVFVAHGEMEI
jgi:trans-2,3-dihydro-3-hydroxyanthranilate isomerase